jgi:c-di-GMP-binding flagellar brake protein YcgR
MTNTARLWNIFSAPNEVTGTSSSLPNVGESVRIQAARGEQVGVFYARVRAVGLRRIVVDAQEALIPSVNDEWGALLDHDPLPSSETVNLAIRTPVTVSFTRGGALFQFETKIVGSGRANTLAIQRPRQVTKVQRRQFYRLPLQSPTTFRVSAEAANSDSDPIAGRMVNLSGGGVLLASPKPIRMGLLVKVRIPVGREGERIDVSAEALDCRVAAQGSARIFLVRLQFLGPPDLSIEDRDLIVAYIFEQQRIILRNRKLFRK